MGRPELSYFPLRLSEQNSIASLLEIQVSLLRRAKASAWMKQNSMGTWRT